MNIKIALDFIKERYDWMNTSSVRQDDLYTKLYTCILGNILKTYLYNEIIEDIRSDIIEKDGKYYIFAQIEKDIKDEKVLDDIVNKYNNLDSRLKKYFKIDRNNIYYKYDETLYYKFYCIKIELTNIDSVDDMIFLDTINKLNGYNTWKKI